MKHLAKLVKKDCYAVMRVPQQYGKTINVSAKIPTRIGKVENVLLNQIMETKVATVLRMARVVLTVIKAAKAATVVRVEMVVPMVTKVAKLAEIIVVAIRVQRYNNHVDMVGPGILSLVSV